MAQQVDTFVENNFTKGLITEATGLNFPENAATATDNCEYTLLGDVTRRLGITAELGAGSLPSNRAGKAISSYKWNNVSGDGNTQIVVEQIGGQLFFYRSSTATTASPLSTQLLPSVILVSDFIPLGGSFDQTIECQFSDGNGYLFVYHPNCLPFFCTYVAGVITGSAITLQIRDFAGINDGLDYQTRPSVNSPEHTYNLINQGWTSGTAWTSGTDTAVNPGASLNHTVVLTMYNSGLPISNGDLVQFSWVWTLRPGVSTVYIVQVTNYTGNVLTGTLVNYSTVGGTAGITGSGTVAVPVSTGFINSWFAAIGNYPANSDVWWYFKNASGVFAPSTQIATVTTAVGPAPKGHFILNAFDQQFSAASGVANLTSITTLTRPKTGTWFQGRVWYTGIDASSPASGDAGAYTWAENIYFSQIVTTPGDFGKCYQKNDPTSETLFDLLPTDGGVITIQGSGSIYKLFPLQNALLVFAANGVWYLTGSSGIGFTANDYTIVKLSSVQSISSTSFVDVQGLPMFWNEEGIYKVEPAKQGTSLLSTPLHVNPLEVNPVTIGTILSFYNEIPLVSKKYVKGAYHPIDYVVQWIYRDTNETDVTSRYSYNKILNFNTHNAAFFPYTVDNSFTSINSITYVAGPGGSNSPAPVFKYLISAPVDPTFYSVTFGEERDLNYVDWGSFNYISSFTTGYKLRGQAVKRFQPQYLYLYTRLNGEPNSYKVQSIWDYANDPNSGRWSVLQEVNHGVSHYDTVHKRIKLRGNGYALQFKVTSTDRMPFDIQGWAAVDTISAGT